MWSVHSGCSSSPQPEGGLAPPCPDLVLTVLQPLLKALPQRLTGPGVPRQLERGFLGEDGAGRLVLVRLDSALEANPGDWRPLVLGSGKDWDQIGKGSTSQSSVTDPVFFVNADPDPDPYPRF